MMTHPFFSLFDDPSAWQVVASGQAEGRLSRISTDDAKPGLRLDYDFHGGGGFVVIRQVRRFTLPETFEIGFRLRGWRGGIIATLGMITAPIIVILLLAMFLRQLDIQTHGARIFQALRITVAAVLLATAIKLMLRACAGWQGWHLVWRRLRW